MCERQHLHVMRQKLARTPAKEPREASAPGGDPALGPPSPGPLSPAQLLPHRPRGAPSSKAGGHPGEGLGGRDALSGPCRAVPGDPQPVSACDTHHDEPTPERLLERGAWDALWDAGEKRVGIARDLWMFEGGTDGGEKEGIR